MPLNCPFETRYKQQYNTTVDCCYTSTPVQTQSKENTWFSENDIETLSGAQNVSAVIKTDGTLWLWGNNERRSLGTNSSTNHSSPVQTISCGTNWKQVSLPRAGTTNQVTSSAIKKDGTLWLWGDGSNGRIGDNTIVTKSSPVQTIACGTNWEQVSLGGSHSAAVKTDGTLWLWGLNIRGQLGSSCTLDASSPIQTVATGTNWKQVSSGECHTSAIKTDGTLWLWGYNNSGQLGNNSTIEQSSPVQTTSATTSWKQVSLGNSHSAAIKTDGTLWIWGKNNVKQLGDNNTIDVSSPVQTVSTGTNWKQLSLGVGYSAAIKTDGTLWLWGYGVNGVLGNLQNKGSFSSPIQTVSTETNWKQVSLGGDHSAAIKTDGTLWLWGLNTCGQLGNNTTTDQSSPVQTISTTTTWTVFEEPYYTFAAGNCHSAAIKTDGTLWLWGLGTCGILGNNNTINVSSPIQTVSTGTNWKQVSLGTRYSASVKTDGTLWLWGCGRCGVLGNNLVNDRSSPIQTIACGTNWKQVSLGTTHSGAIKNDGTLWLWGEYTHGRLGSNSTADECSPVQTTSATTNWKQVSLGFSHSAAVKTDGTLWLWGHNVDGVLGNNSGADPFALVQTISCGTNWKQVSLGCNHSSAIKTDGTLWVWGAADNGQLGTNNLVAYSSPVQTVSTGTNWKQIRLATPPGQASSAIKTDGTLWLWGLGTCGILGNNSTINRSSPIQTTSTSNFWKEVSIGSTHTLAVDEQYRLFTWGDNSVGQLGCNLSDGVFINTDLGNILVDKEYLLEVYPNIVPNMKAPALWGWGQNNRGQLGNNLSADQSSPIQTITNGSNWKQVSVGDSFSAVIKTDGTLWLWGNGNCGVLGNNSTTDRSSPVQTVSTGTNWKQVSSSSNCFLAAIKTDGTLWLWGRNGQGRLGDTTTTNTSSPIQTVSTGTNWKQVSLGSNHSAATKIDGTLWLWGQGSCGKLGNNSTINQSSPVQTISGGTDWKQVSLGEIHSAAIKTDGTLWLWGCNGNGRLGNNDTIDRCSPIQTVSTGTNWKQVSLGTTHSGAIKTDGTLWLWGENNCGQFGDRTLISKSSPIQTISTGTNWKQVSAGLYYVSAIKTDGTLWLWGNGACGMLGNNSTINQSSPVQTISGGTDWKQVSSANGGYSTLAIRETYDW